MRYIDLNILTENDILGHWQVSESTLPDSASASLFRNVEKIVFDKNSYSADNGATAGAISMVRERKIIYNPQLKFYDNSSEVATAIITRLKLDKIGEKDRKELSLYFSDGLELVLHKNN